MRLLAARALALAAVLGTVVAGSPAALQAQGDQCELSQGPTLNRQGDFLFISGRFRLDCSGGVVLLADSAVNIQSTEEIYLIGNVSFRDSVKALEADWAHYQSQLRYLVGRGDVVVTDIGTGSTVIGETLRYWRAGRTGEPERVLVEGERPHAVLYSAAEATAEQSALPPDSATSPTEIDANVIELIGQQRFNARGNVVIVRDEMVAYGSEAMFDEATNRMELIDSARVDGEAYDLTGRRIEALLSDSGSVERVTARGQADLTSEDVRVQGPELRVFFDAGDPSRLIALGARRVSDSTEVAVDATRASATSEAFRLLADSIDVLAHGENLDSLVAVGHAYSEQIQDSVRAADLPEIATRDWARGDTIRAYFTAVDSAGEPTAPEPARLADPRSETGPPGEGVTLERMVVIGGGEGSPAQTLYRERNPGEAGGRPDINYLVAATITVRLEDGVVHTVTAEGPVQGLQLQPRTRTEPADRPEGTSP